MIDLTTLGGGGSGDMLAANNLSDVASAATSRTNLGLGTMATQAASAVAITGGTVAGLTGLAIRDTSAAYDLTIGATSATALTAARSLTLDVGNASQTLKFTAASTITFPSGTNTLATLAANTFTAAQTIASGTLTASAPALNITQTWNSGAVTFVGAEVNIVATAYNTASRLFSVASSSVPIFQVRTSAPGIDLVKIGSPADSYHLTLTSTWGSGGDLSYYGNFTLTGGGVVRFGVTSAGNAALSSATPLAWSSTTAATGTADLLLHRDAAGVMALKNSTNAQTFRIYGTYTDASNYVRAAINTTSTTVALAAETAGTGADNIDLTLTAAGTGIVNCTGTTGLGINGTKVLGAQAAAVADASGGAVVDAEARTALNDLLAKLRTHGIIAT